MRKWIYSHFIQHLPETTYNFFYLEIQFYELSKSQMDSDSTFKEIVTAIKSITKSISPSAQLYKAYSAMNETSKTYRIIFE